MFLSAVRRTLVVLVLIVGAGFAGAPRLLAQTTACSPSPVTKPVPCRAAPSPRTRPNAAVAYRRSVEEALRLLRVGDTTRADLILAALEAEGVAEPRIYLVRAELARTRPDLGLALAVLRHGHTRLPRHREIARAYAYALAFGGDLVRAEQLFDSLVITQPTDRASALGRAWSLAWRGRLEAATTAFEALDGPVRGTRVDALFGLAWVARAQGDTGTARERYQRVLSLDATHAEARAALAGLTPTPARSSVTVPFRDTVRASRPDLPRADDGWSALARGDTAAALAWFQAHLTRSTASVASLRTLGVLARGARLYPLAEEAFLAARTRDPLDRATAMELAVLYGWTDRGTAADALYAEVLRRAPDDQEAHLGRARLAYWAQRLPAARAEVQAVLSRTPDHGEALLLLGDIARAAWHLSAARDAYTRAARDAHPAIRSAATDRLAQLAYESRGEMVLMGGTTHTTGLERGTATDLLASLQWQWTAAWQTSLGVAVNALGDVRTVTLPTDPTQATAAQTAWVGVRWTPAHPVSLSTTAYLRTADSVQALAWWLDGSLRLGPAVRLIAGAHLREVAPQAPTTASWIVSALGGIALQGPARHGVSISTVWAPPLSGEPAWTTTARLDGAPVSALQYAVSFSQATAVGRAFTSVEGSTTLFPVPRLGLRVAGLSRTGTFARRAAWGGLIVRF